MFNIVITEKGGKPRVEAFDQNEITIGRVQGNDIVLPKGNISKRHSRIVLRDGKFIVVDLKSTNGTYVNGKRINSPQVLKDVDKVYIGDFTLIVEEERAAVEEPAIDNIDLDADDDMDIDDINAIIDDADDDDGVDLFDDDEDGEDLDFGEDLDDEPAPAPSPPPPAAPKPKPKPKPKKKRAAAIAPAAPKLEIELPPAAAMNARGAVFSSVFKALTGGADNGVPASDDATLAKAQGAAEKTLQAVSKKLTGVAHDGWAKEIADEVCGLGPLKMLFSDESVTEVFINGPLLLLCKKDGVLESSNLFFSSAEALDLVLRRVMHQSGQSFSAKNPVASAHIDDLRFEAVHQSAARNGPLVTVTRSSHLPMSLDGLAQEEILSSNMASFLRTCVQGRKGILVVGAPGADVDAVTAALASEAADHERIVIVERSAKLTVQKPHVLSLQAQGAASAQEMIMGALRMRPNRLVVSELSGSETLEVILAMGGHQAGAIASTHASDARSALHRLETMMQVGAQETSARALREQIAAAVHVVVVVTRFADGSDKVTEIVEVSGTEVDLITTQELFVFRRDGFDDDGSIQGLFKAKGTPPRFYDELERRGVELDRSVFRD